MLELIFDVLTFPIAMLGLAAASIAMLALFKALSSLVAAFVRGLVGAPATPPAVTWLDEPSEPQGTFDPASIEHRGAHTYQLERRSDGTVWRRCIHCKREEVAR